MSDTPEEEPTSITVPLALIILIVVLAVPVWMGYSETHRDERENARAHYEQVRFTDCLSPDWSNASTCLKEAIASEYDQTAEYYDLKAQQDMAKWSLLMFGITAIGVGYIAMTLHATRSTLKEAERTTAAANRTVDETRRIGEAQVRAYLTYENARFQYGGDEARLSFEIHNSGQSPARFILASTVSCTVFIEADQGSRTFFQSAYDDPMNIFLGNCKAGDMQSVSIPLSLTKEETREIAQNTMSQKGYIGVVGLFKWKDVFGKTHVEPFGAQKHLVPSDNRNVEINSDSITEDYVRKVWAVTREEANQLNQ